LRLPLFAPRRSVLLLVLFLCGAWSSVSFAQVGAQSGPQSGRQAAFSESDPALILRDTLMAACSQNVPEFTHALTLRNAEAFARMTPAARSTLLKRFVLLDKPGEPSAEQGASGMLIVRCKTPEITTEMEIGKVELRENIAYLPLSVRDAASGDDSALHKVTMGLVRESGQWKLLSLGLLLLDLPSLEQEWDRAEIKANEQSALASLQKLADAVESYRKTYTRLPDTVTALGPSNDGTSKPDHAGLLDSDLIAGRKDGYIFRYVIVGANTSGALAKYEIAAIPAEYGRGGLRSFLRDSSGAVHGADHQGAVGSTADPRVDQADAPSGESRR
jgi:hypothetical protein